MKSAIRVFWNVLITIIAVAIGILSTACGASPVQEKMEMTDKQFSELEDYLIAETGIVLIDANASVNPVVEDIGDGFQAFDVQTDNGQTYLLIIDDTSKGFVAILDENNEIINGLVDRGVLPKLFAERYE